MPSEAHHLMMSWLRDGRESGAGPLEAEARAAAHQPPHGMTEEAVPTLRAGSLLITPPGARDDIAIVYVHGGGFRSGTPQKARALAGRLAAATRARVLLPAYRLAPEHPYPAGLDDCEAGYLYAAGLVPDGRVVVGGESAGANLAAALLLRRRDLNDVRPVAGFLYSGMFDLRRGRFHGGSWLDNAATDLVLTVPDGPPTSDDYLGTQQPETPFASPVAADPHGLPALFIQVSSAEMLLDDSLELAARAARAGVPVELDVVSHLQHAWQLHTGFLPEADEAVGRTVAFIERALDSGQTPSRPPTHA